MRICSFMRRPLSWGAGEGGLGRSLIPVSPKKTNDVDIAEAKDQRNIHIKPDLNKAN